MMLSREEAEEVLSQLKFKRRLSEEDLIVAIAQDWASGEVLMQAYMNREAALQTLSTGRATYWSTSRRQLWVKGETSGAFQELRGFRIDCDGDAVVLLVEPKGPSCHTGLHSCFDTYERFDIEGMKRRLVQSIKKRALVFGDFTLTSGKKSTYYLDVKKLITNPPDLALISLLIAHRFGEGVDVVAGPELGAVPIVVSVASRLRLPFVMLRRGERTHGTGRRIEGQLSKGQKILLIDDVATSGGSLVGSVQAIQDEGAQVAVVTCVVDRQEGAREKLEEKYGLELSPLVTADELGLKP